MGWINDARHLSAPLSLPQWSPDFALGKASQHELAPTDLVSVERMICNGPNHPLH